MLRKTRALVALTVGAASLTALPASGRDVGPAAALAPAFPTVSAQLAVAAPPAGLEPGTALHVTGTIRSRDARTGAVGRALSATYRLRVHNADRSIERVFGPFRTGDGTIDTTLPAAATAGVTPTAETGYREVLAVTLSEVTPVGGATVADAAVTGAWISRAPTGLRLDALFTSSVGWVKPGQRYPLRLIVRNYSAARRTGVVVTMRGVDGMLLRSARGATVRGNRLTWKVGTVAGGTTARPTTRALIVEAQAKTLRQDPRVTWKNISTTATMTYRGGRAASTTHGPKVIPVDPIYDTARYGDRPFPVIPIDYSDHKHQTKNSSAKIAQIINDPNYTGSTFQLFQEQSLKQLFPHGTVPSVGVATAPVKASDGFRFTVPDPAGTCRGITQVNPTTGEPLDTYTERIHDGWYQLPGNTDYYGDDRFGSGYAAARLPVGTPLFSIDDACGAPGKAAYDAAVVADPDLDYSDYDTDKDGLVDFFEIIYTGLGGHGHSQGVRCYPSDSDPVNGRPAEPTNPDRCPLAENPPRPYYDNIWPHSSSLEYYYTDAATGQSGYVSKDQLKDHYGRPMYYTDGTRSKTTTRKTAFKVFVRVGPYNVNPENSLQHASVISHEYGHSLGLPDFYSRGGRSTYGDWNLMATDKSQNMDIFSKQDMGWIIPREVPKGTTTVHNWRDSKIDTHQITWKTPDGKPYTLSGPTVHNALAYTAKLPGKKLIDPSKLKDASPTHVWWSQSGDDFGCPPEGGHNLDIYLPDLKNVAAGTKVTASFKSLWDIEWDYDYGFVMTGVPDSRGRITSYTAHPSQKGYTSPAEGPTDNPQQSSCLAKHKHGITGSSGSYRDQTATVDRIEGNYPDPTFLADSYDISALAGKGGVLRFSYATDPGLARPGWFIDDLVVTAGSKVIYRSNFEKTGGPGDGRVFNGGCKDAGAVAEQCTAGWQYVDAKAGSPADHGYYLEMRDRSGFDFDGKGQNDRAAINFQPGLLLVYTNEANGYGNTGGSYPPPQSPLDAKPDAGTTDPVTGVQSGSLNPNLHDAAFNLGEAFQDRRWLDNYRDPLSESGRWEFRYGCLSFRVSKMSGDGVGPNSPWGRGGDLRGSVVFTRSGGCKAMNYGHTDPSKGSAAAPATAERTASTSPSAGMPHAGIGPQLRFW